MTLPFEKFNSIRLTREFLYKLLDPKKTPKVPKKVRSEVYSCLRHFPSDHDMIITAKKLKSIWGKD